jgi:beta-lactamase superfamily II metal-dependent hydrolase
MADRTRISLLDVGDREYGECLLIESAGRRILIDGAHQGDDLDDGAYLGIVRQLQELTGEQKVAIDLLILSHAHADHVGCLPELVTRGVVGAEWALVPDQDLAWGRPIGSPTPARPDAVNAAIAGLREERPSVETLTDDARLAEFLADAVSVEDRYAKLLDGLHKQGTKIIRHGRREDAALLAAFGGVGLEILGPSLDQMLLTAELMGQAMDAIAEDATVLTDSLADVDAGGLAVYRGLLSGAADAPKSRPGNLVNLQSLALAFSLDGRRSFFGGDMELANSETGNAQIRAEVTALRHRIRKRGPYAYAQLGHHGSSNATNASTLEDLGLPALVGMSAGRASDKHPSGDVLRTLALGRQRWVRTDRNGQIRIEARGKRGWTVRPARGQANDPTPADADAHVGPGSNVTRTGAVAPRAGASVSPAVAVSRVSMETRTTMEDGVEVSIRTSRPVRVTISLDGETGGRPEAAVAVTKVASVSGTPSVDSVSVGAGRRLPPLLYVTDPSRLAANVGASEADVAMAALRAAPGRLLEIDGARPSTEIRIELARELDDIEGIVLVGGYDVVPSDVIDTLPPALATSISRAGDADQFIVWTDDLYAQIRGAATLPISRIPDGHASDVLFRALSAGASRAASASGVRNVKRPFADVVYQALTGGAPLLVSEPALAPDARGRLGGDTVYFMLHGYWRDATRLWGEAAGEYPEAVNLSSVQARDGSVIFSGACWGALIVDVQAVRYAPNVPLGSRGPAESIALAYLAGGASAFVGCTGSHYSPSTSPYRSAGAPIHYSFFTYLSTGRPPAVALAQAKRDYVAAMPHSDAGPGALAVEHKLVWQFTCLGLGW